MTDRYIPKSIVKFGFRSTLPEPDKQNVKETNKSANLSQAAKKQLVEKIELKKDKKEKVNFVY